jgi:hypothetical protein
MGLSQRESVNSRLYLIISLFVACTSWHAAAQEVVSSVQNSSCFQDDDKWGRLPIPGCSAKLKPPWSERAEIYSYNKMGLRGPDFSPKPDKKTVRVLLLGPLFDGFGLSSENGAEHRLEERVKAIGFKNFEVINGNIPGFFAPRSAEYAMTLIKAYQPDLVIYFQTANATSHDLLEQRALHFQGEEVEKFVPVVRAVSAPPLLGWLWPAPETQAMLAMSYHQLVALWDIHKHSATSDEEALKYLDPSIRAFQKIQKQMGPQQRLVIFYSAQAVQNGMTGGTQPGGAMNSLFNRLAPPLYLPPDLVSQYLHVYPMARGFRSPVQNDLVYEQHPNSLTPQGSHAFAWSAAYWIKPEIQSLDKGKGIKIAESKGKPRHRRGGGGKGNGRNSKPDGDN